MTVSQHVQRKTEEVQKQYDLLSERISRVRKELAIATDVEEKFRLEERMKELEQERDALEQQLESAGAQNILVPIFSQAAQGKYLERLEAQILREFHQDQYVMLNVESMGSEDTSTLTAIQQALHSSFDIHVAEGMLVSGRTSPLAAAVANQRLVTLLGGPGVGKTTSLRFIALQQIQHVREDPDSLLPIWIALGKWDDQELSAEAFLWQEFNALLDEEPVSQETFAAWLQHGKLLVLLDGLNELPQRKLENKYVSPQEEAERVGSAGSRIPDARENSLLVLARQCQSRFLLSCRILEYTHIPGWQEFRILPLSNEQISDFIHRHLGSQSQYLETILEQQPHLRDLGQNPFYLRSLVLLAQVNYRSIPTDRFQLVKYTCDAALAREAPRRGFAVQDVLKPVAQDALGAMHDGFIGSWFRTLIEVNSEQVNAFECAVGSGLLIRVGGDDEHVFYRYLHQLVQEALALTYLETELFTENAYSEVQSLARIGQIHLKWGKLKEAEENLQRALELCPSVGAESLRASILLSLSRVYRVWRRTREGMKYAEAAVQLVDSLGDSVELAETYHELGLVNQRLRRTQEAERYYQLALGVYERLVERSRYAYEIVHGLGDFYADRKIYRIPLAIRWYKKALAIFEECEDQDGVARCKLEMAVAYRWWGATDEAENLFRWCAKEFERLENRGMKMRSLLQLGFCNRSGCRPTLTSTAFSV
jgi:tetratricopeptide (TPR) repeat protein